MPKIAQFNRHKIVYLNQQVDSQRVISQTRHISSPHILCSVSLKNPRKPTKEEEGLEIYRQLMNSI